MAADPGVLGFTFILRARRGGLPEFVPLRVIPERPVPSIADLPASGLGVTTPKPVWSANERVRLASYACLSAPPEGGATSPGICAMISEMRARLLTSALDLCGFVVILLVGKAVGPTVVDTGYVRVTGRMLKWAWAGLVLLWIVGQGVSGCERSEGDLGLRSRGKTLGG